MPGAHLSLQQVLRLDGLILAIEGAPRKNDGQMRVGSPWPISY
jgi:hypothetical protein